MGDWVIKAGFPYPERKEILIGGVKAIRSDKQDIGFGEVAGDIRAMFNGKGYQITYQPYDSNLLSVFEQVLSTLHFFSNPEEAARWKHYINNEFGFEIRYPDYYYDLKAVKSIARKKDIFIGQSGGLEILGYREEISANLSLEATSKTKDLFPIFRINIFDLGSYRFTDIPGGIEYGYDIVKENWWKNALAKGRTETDLEIVKGDGWIGYKLATGDAGYAYYTVVIPKEDRRIMLEIGFLFEDTTRRQIPVETMLSTLKFTAR